MLLVYLVNLDVQTRVDCALGRAPDCMVRSNPSFSYSVLIQFFSMRSENTLLTSPPVLDWTQVFVLLLIILNVWYFLPFFRRRSSSESTV